MLGYSALLSVSCRLAKWRAFYTLVAPDLKTDLFCVANGIAGYRDDGEIALYPNSWQCPNPAAAFIAADYCAACITDKIISLEK